MTAAVSCLLVVTACSDNATSTAATTATTALTPETTAEDGDRMSLAEYYDWVGATLSFAIGDLSVSPPSGGTLPQFESARETLGVRADFYERLLATFEGVTPPVEAASAHEAYIAAAAENAMVLRKAAERAPADAPPEDVAQYEYADADTGYAFVAETNAKCALNRVFDSTGFTPYEFQRWCDPVPRSGTSVGTADAPVNEVEFVHEPVDRPAHPNMWFDITNVTASSKAPIRFTLENRHPEPYFFNIAIYEGNPETLKGLKPIAQTVAATGAFVVTLEVDLEPGVYTYADNVHAYSMRGTLIVV